MTTATTPTRSRLRALAAGALAASLLTVGPAAAQEINGGNVSLGAGADFTTDYYFRGIIQETEGFITQPFLEGGLTIGAATVTAGTWSSLHSGPSGSDGAPGDPALWYETDFYTGVGFSFAEGWSTDVTYTAYMSPNQSFGTVKELSLGLGYDDGLLGPYATFAFELDGQADGGPDGGEGVYLELGVEPGLDLGESPLAVSFPVTFGLSLDQYYQNQVLPTDPFEDSSFGFFQVGAILSVPLGLPAQYGDWGISGGVNFLFFGDGLQIINGSDDSSRTIGVFGISLGY